VVSSLEEANVASVFRLCQTLEISRSAYYAWRSNGASSRAQEDTMLSEEIMQIFWYHRRRYGARRITDELKDRGHAVNRKRVIRIMNCLGIKAIQPKSFKPRSTESRHRLGYSENLLYEAKITRVGQAWVGDITYIPCGEFRYCYLSVLMDLCSRRIVGWHFNSDMTENLVITALRNAIATCKPAPGLIHHTDRGGQYAGKQYRNILTRAEMKQSMSRANDCYDNAFMESCFGTIKKELEMTEYKTMHEAKHAIQRYVSYYNFERKTLIARLPHPNSVRGYSSLTAGDSAVRKIRATPVIVGHGYHYDGTS
jgi:putative transposase